MADPKGTDYDHVASGEAAIKTPPSEARSSTSSDDEHGGKQTGVRRLEAIATTWSRTALFVAYGGCADSTRANSYILMHTASISWSMPFPSKVK